MAERPLLVAEDAQQLSRIRPLGIDAVVTSPTVFEWDQLQWFGTRNSNYGLSRH